MSIDELKDISPKPPSSMPSSAHVVSGVPIPKAVRVRTFSPDAWEEFIEEWASSLKGQYIKVRRFGGSGDMGIDIAGFSSGDGFSDPWDNYQCKRYDHPLRPSDVWVEIGKIIYYSFKGYFLPPSKHYFVCSQGIGTQLEKLLNKTDELKKKSRENWDAHCRTSITDLFDIPLSGDLDLYFQDFNFSIFTSRSVLEVIDGHAQTGYHSVRFGGGLPQRPEPNKPPLIPTEGESRYIRQLLDAYGEHLGAKITEPAALDVHSDLKRDYLRQRERFYHAEALRNFARDTVPDGTFDALQDEIYHGVVDVCEGKHGNGLERMRATIAQAASVATTSNALATAVQVQDRQGVCHQLANDDRLTWVLQND